MNNYQDGYLVRTRDKKSRFYIDNEFFNNGYAELLGRKALVYFVLAKYANARTQTCFPSYETLMKQSGVKHRSLIPKVLRALIHLRLIAVKRSKGRHSNRYYLLDVSEWKPLDSTICGTVGTVLKMSTQQYRNWILNRTNSGTGNLSLNSTYKIPPNYPQPVGELKNQLKEKMGWPKE